MVKERGVSVIAIEHLSSDIQREVEIFINTGKISKATTPALDWFVNFSLNKGLLALLNQVRTLRQQGFKVELTGNGGTFQEAGDAFFQKIDSNKGLEIINRDCKRIVAEALKKGKKVALYNGALHNDINPTKQTAHFSYVKDLALGDAFVEMDLIVPERYTPDGNLEYFSLALKAPQSGVYLKSSGKSHVLIFPRTGLNPKQ